MLDECSVQLYGIVEMLEVVAVEIYGRAAGPGNARLGSSIRPLPSPSHLAFFSSLFFYKTSNSNLRKLENFTNSAGDSDERSRSFHHFKTIVTRALVRLP